MALLSLINKGKALYNDINRVVTKATWDENALSNWIQKLAEWVTNQLTPKKTLRSQFTTNTNPSKNFPWISQEDENEMRDILDSEFADASEMEQKFALEWLYQQYVKMQWEKDLEARKQSAKRELNLKAAQTNNAKERNEYMDTIRTSDLADLIKFNYRNQWFDTSSLNWNNDDEIVWEFLNNNPSYQQKFNKYMYWDQDIISLGKDLGWLEKNNWDKINTWLNKVWQSAAWTIWDFWDWIQEWLNLLWANLWIWDSQEDAFANYVEKNYGTAVANLTDKDRKKAEEDFKKLDDNWVQTAYEENKSTVQWAVSKTAKWALDIALTSKSPFKFTATKAWFWWLANAKELPHSENDLLTRAWLDLAEWTTNLIWEGINLIWSTINSLPLASQFRDSLQTEQEREEWDNFVWSLWLVWLVKWYGNMKSNWGMVKSLEWLDKNIDVVAKQFKEWTKAWAKSIYEWIKEWQTPWEILENTATKVIEEWYKPKMEQRQAKDAEYQKAVEERNEIREELSRKVWAWKERQTKQLDKSITNLTKEEWFADVDTYKKLREFNNKKINELKDKQNQLASENPKHYIWDDLVMKVDWIKTAPISDMLKKLKERAEEVWDVEWQAKYTELTKKLNRWWFWDPDVLEVRRNYNSEFWQDAFKEWELKAGMSADKAANLMKYWNRFIEEKTNMSKELRDLDSELSAHYTLQWRVNKLLEKQNDALNKLNDIEENKLTDKVGEWVSAAFNSIFVSLKSIVFRVAWDVLKQAMNSGKKKVNAYNMDEILKERLDLITKLNEELPKIKSKGKFIEVMTPIVEKLRATWLTLDEEENK